MAANPKNPYDTFFWIDWENDENLKQCSDAAQGIWMRLLCIMARSPERGVLMLGKWPAGRREIVKPLAAYLGREEGYLEAIIDELVNSETASLDEQGRIINRRMVRKYAISQARSEAGKRGAETTNASRQKSGKGVGKRGGNDSGNHSGKDDGKPVGKTEWSESALSADNTMENPDNAAEQPRQNSGNHPGKEGGNDDGKTPAKGSPSSSFMLQASYESRNSLPVTTLVNGAGAPDEPELIPDDDLTPPLILDRSPEAAAVRLWNETADAVNAELGHAEWPRVQKLTPDRKRQVRKRLADGGGIEGFRIALGRARADPWARGETPRPPEHANWRFNFDHFVKEKTFTQIMEKPDDDPSRRKAPPRTDLERARAGIDQATAGGSVPDGGGTDAYLDRAD